MNDRWITQTKFYDPSQPPEVCTGNCTEAAIASLFGISLDDVPSMQGLAGSDYWEALEAFVRSRGFALSMHSPSRRPDGLYLADGNSGRGCGHFVVMRDGKMVHDPHPSRAGLLEIEHVWSLTALDPAALAARQPVGKIIGYMDPEADFMLPTIDSPVVMGKITLFRSPADKWTKPLYDGPPAQAVDLGAMPDGWRLSKLATCYQLSHGNDIIGNLVGPDAEENAAIIARALDRQAEVSHV